MKIVAIVLIFFLIIILFILLFKKKCKPHCSGAFCGSNSDDGCGGTCNCNKEGNCINGICCYPNCNGKNWGDDGCGGTCDCDIIPNGIKQTTNKGEKICCYAQDCNNVYCGSDGCGNVCGCQQGSTCSSQGICANSGTPGYIYNIIKSTGIQQTNVSSPEECAGWLPQNVDLNLTSFPCEQNSDCPYGDTCEINPINNKKYCNRNNVYQWWFYDPSNPSGFNCTKIKEGSTVCALPKDGAYAFDIAGNKSPSLVKCSDTCKIYQTCPSVGENSCCPSQWAQKGNTAYCTDNRGVAQCCLNNPDVTGYNDCIKSYSSCENVSSAWWEGNLGEIENNSCGVQMKGGPIHINEETLQDPIFSVDCKNKNSGDSCTYDDGKSSFTGLCKTCSDGSLKCLPDIMCTRVYASASQPGMCTTKNLCN